MSSNDEFGDGLKKSSMQNRKLGKYPPAAITAGEVDDDDDGAFSLDVQETKPNVSKSSNGLQPKPSRKGGWGTDGSSKSKKRNELEADFEDDRLRPKTQPEDDAGAESDPDVPFIPELEGQPVLKGGQGQVAMAPHVAVNRVATYKELDYELVKHSTFLSLDNEIDLKMLAKGLSSEAEVTAETDVTWEWDQLFAEVTSELLTEWESQELGQEKTGA